MIKNNSLSKFRVLFFFSVTYFLVILINNKLIINYMETLELSFSEADQISYYQILGMLSAATVLILFSTIGKMIWIVIFGLVLHFFSVFGVIFVDIPHNTVGLICFFIYTFSIAIIGFGSFCYIMCDDNIKSYIKVSIISISWITAFVLVKILSLILHNSDLYFIVFIIFDISSLVVFVVTIMGFVFDKDDFKDEYNFLSIVRYSEIEMLSGFSMFFVLMVVIDGYSIYSITDSLYLMISTGNEYIVTGLLIFTISLSIVLIESVSIHKLNISCISLMIILFTTMPYWGLYHQFIALLCWFLLGMAFYTIISANIFLLSQKFYGNSRFSSLVLYITLCSVGYYCGYITTDYSVNDFGENEFLFSISFVLFGLFIYYLYLFNKHKLYSYK